MKKLMILIAVLLIAVLLGHYVLQDEKARSITTAEPDIAAPDSATEPKPETIIVPAPEIPEEKPFQYEPKTLMPLAVGNKWVYQWSSTDAGANKDNEGGRRGYHCWREYGYDNKGMLYNVHIVMIIPHEETYEIVRQDGEHFFFTVTAPEEVGLTLARDGRYDDSVELCWTWWDKREQPGGSVGLTESIKRNWGEDAVYLLDGKPIPENKFDLPADHRDTVRVEFENGEWGNSFVGIWEVGSRYRFRYQPSQLEKIEVPAGTYTDCIESIEKFSGKAESDGKQDEWETHIFWAPGVGKVYEYQVLPDGRKTYELKLVSCELN